MLSPCAAIVQRHDPERFVTVLFAPAPARETLFVLYAFNHELARAREATHTPPLALIRLHWWREVVDGADRRHEVATPLRQAIAANRLHASLLHTMIDARTLEAEETIELDQFETYLTGTAGTLMQQAGEVLGAAADDGLALARLGAACGAVGLLRNAPAFGAAGRWSRPDGMTEPQARADAAARLGALPRRWRPAALPAALPAVIARRRLRSPDRAAFSLTDRLALWRAAQSCQA